MNVKELMASHVCYVKPETPLSRAASLMKQQDIGFLPVCDNKNALLGIVTDRDILLALDFLDPQLSAHKPVAEIMSPDPATVSSDLSVHDAALIFSRKKVRRLPVVENGRLVGVLSLSDLAKKRIFLAEVGDIMAAIRK